MKKRLRGKYLTPLPTSSDEDGEGQVPPEHDSSASGEIGQQVTLAEEEQNSRGPGSDTADPSPSGEEALQATEGEDADTTVPFF